MIKISIDTSQFDKKLAAIPGAMERAKRKALQNIGTRVMEETTRAFKDPVLRPSPWAPRKDNLPHPLLIKHPNGGLRSSIISRLDGVDAVVVGTDKKYAPYHQHGTKKMPARPFFPVDATGQLTPRIAQKIKADVEAAYLQEINAAFNS